MIQLRTRIVLPFVSLKTHMISAPPHHPTFLTVSQKQDGLHNPAFRTEPKYAKDLLD